MIDPSLSDKLAALSPEQLEKLRSRFNQHSQPSAILPREQVSAIPAEVRSEFNGQVAWRATSTQARLWFLEQYLGPNPIYNIAKSLRLYGELNVAALDVALRQIVQRHEALRTTFHGINGVPYQVIGDSQHFRLELVDLQTVPTSEQESEFQRQLQAWGQRPFDLTQDCLLRAVLFQLADTEFGLLIAVHHIAGDGWSFGVLARELSSLYGALISEQTPSLSPLSLQFADYSLWLHTQLQQSRQESHRRYWQQQLSGELPVLDLPCDRPRGSEQTYNGKQASITLEPAVVAGLKTLGNQAGASLFMVLLASFKVLLHRYSQQTDIIVGTPIANRSRPELEEIVGYFVDNLPLRTDLSGNPSFWALLERVRQTALNAYRYVYPFAEILESISVIRDPSRSPVFSVMMSLQNTPEADLELPGILLSNCELDEVAPQPSVPLSSYRFSQDIQVARFDLTVLLKEEHGEIAGVIEYNQNLFNPDTIDRLIGHWQTLLPEILANPYCPIGQLPLLTAAERHQLLVSWNQTQADYPQDKCIHQLFEAQVEQTPDAIAVVCEKQQLTYRELNHRANQLAHYLQSLGVGPEMPVGICVERSIAMVIGLFGILKAGGAYVPLDPTYPSDRLCFMLEDAQVRILITQSSLQANFAQHNAHVVCLDTDWQAIHISSTSRNLASGVRTNNLAYIIYTSGSTGKPKGVQICHHAVVNLLNSMRHRPGLTEHDVLLAVTTISFDIAVLELYLPLMVGARVVLATREIATDAAQLSTLLAQSGVTVMQATPATWRMLLAGGWQGDSQLKMLCGGEVMTRELADQLLAHGGELWHMYGPTETTVWSTACPVTPGEGPIPVAGPIANTQLYVLETVPQPEGDTVRPLPIGIAGEVHIGGDDLARGYLNRPKLTQARFIADPFSGQAGARLYKTGDLARFRPDGTLEFLGRIDHQVKIRGFRIELGEIEAALSQHPVVQQAVVIAREDEPGDQRLVAYVVAVAAALPTAAGEFRQFLQQTLPDYMLPSAIVHLQSLPLTPNGKIDRRALPRPEAADLALSPAYVAPRSPLEQQLADIWVEVLKLEPVGIHDNFFELGGHSLLATQVITRIQTLCQIDLPLRRLFEAPTIAQLCESIDPTIVQTEETLPAIPRRQDAQPAQLSFAQQRLWLLQQLDPHSTAYHLSRTLRLQGALNIPALQQALAEIVQRHESLRTTCVATDGIPLQVITDPPEFHLPRLDLRTQAPDAQPGMLASILKQVSERPFDLTSDLMLRATLIRLSENEHVLQMVMHHIASDGWSMGIFTRELSALYQAYANGQSNPLPDLPIQYADFSHWQRQWLTGDVLEAQLRYWKQNLSGAPALLPLPTDHPRPPQPSYQGSRLTFTVSPSLSEALKQLSQQTGTTLFMTLLAAFNTLLYRYTQQDDIVVGSPIANRNRLELEGLIGFFANTLALRTDLSGNPSFHELLARVRQVTLDSYAHQDLPFEKLVEELQPERNLSHSPLFQVMFALQNAPGSGLQLAELSIQSEPVENATAKFDLMLSMSENADGLIGVFEYSTDLFETATIERMTGHFQTLLEGIVANPDESIATLPLLTEAERHQLLVEWNQTQTDYPRDTCIHQLFEEQVERTPDAIAVVFEDQQLTYRELNHRANQLAHYLQALGVGSESLVGFCVERSFEMVIGLLAILKVGAAYVPLDPSYPDARLMLMLDNTQVSVLLTESQFLGRFSSCPTQFICLDTQTALLERQSPENPINCATADSLAYVMYTSGSTGQPKGVSICHRGVVRLVQNTDYARMSAEDVFLQLAPIAFDAATFEIWGALLNGARLVLFPHSKPTLVEIGQVIAQHQITTLWLTAGLFHLMVDERLEDLRPVQQLLAGGDVLSLPHAQKVVEHLAGCTLINGYGPTENTTFTCCYSITSVEQIGQSIPIGRPIANTQVYILDDHRQLVAIGVPGELYVGGAGVARGYYNCPALSQERFIPNPFSSGIDDRLYKTGDLVRYLPDGNIEFLGRIDHQVKIRGFRIELGEVEAALSQHPGIQNVVVIAREDEPGDKRLVAYWVAVDAEVPSSRELRQFLQQTLPDYMIPSAFVHMEFLPLTPNGKIDQRALPLPSDLSADLVERVPPRTLTEEIIARIWIESLGLPESLCKGPSQIHIHDNFFEVGGHSLTATQLIHQIRTVLQVEMPLRQLFETPTIAQLAAYIAAERQAQAEHSPQRESSSCLIPIQPSGSKRPFFLVPGGGGGESELIIYSKMLYLLGQGQPVYGFRTRGQTDNPPPHPTVEAIAAEYIQALRTIQPQGPYLLGGECIGGVVAFEMAQQLQAQGQLIDLILLDTHCPTRARVQRYQRRLWKNRIKRLPSDLAKLVSPLAQRQAVEPEGQPLTPLNRLQPAKEYLLSKLNFGDRNRRSYPYVILRYQPQPYPGRLTILTNEIDYQKHPTLGWELWADAITVHPLVGDHESYLGTYAKVNASRLKACLDAAPASEGSSLDDRS